MLALFQEAENTTSEWWSKLLGIDRVNLAEGEWSLDWHTHVPLWVMVLVVIPLLCGVVWSIYRRERRDVGKGPKIFLTGVRAVILLLILLVLLGPVITVETVKQRKSYLIVLLDDSLSMLKQDPPVELDDKKILAWVTGKIDSLDGEITPTIEEELKKLSRAEVMQAVFGNKRFQILDKLEEKLNIAYFVFSKGARQLKDREEFLSTSPSGTETAVGDAIRQSLSRLRGQHVVGIVIFSDGRSNSGTDPVAISRELKSRYIPIYTVPAGIKSQPRDIQLLELQALEAVLANDPLKIEYKIRSFGFEDQTFEVPLYVYKIDPDNPIQNIPTERADIEKLINESELHGEPRSVTLKGNNERQVEILHFKTDKPGDYILTVKIDVQEGENNPHNNYLLHRVRVADDKIRVLFVEHPPRYEYRYLKNALIRDDKILVHCLLTSADIGFVQEHSQGSDDEMFKKPIREFPKTLKDLLEYDVLILGDVDVGKIGGEPAAEMIRKFVAEFGGGVIFMSGEMHNPRTILGSAMASMLPVVPEEPRNVYNPDKVYDREFGYKLTASGLQHQVVKNCWPNLSDDMQKIIEQWEDRDQRRDGLHGLRWFSPVRTVKPGAQTLVEVTGVQGVEKNPPLFVVQHFGRGRVFWSATDETWLWRYKVGDSPWFYPFWRQAMYWTRHGKLLGAVRYRIDVDKDRYMQNETVNIYASAYDQNYEPLVDEKLTIYVEPPEGKRVQVELGRDKTREGYYIGTYQPTVLGRYKIWAGEDDEMTRAYDKFVVFVPNREQANPVLDVESLFKVASASHQVKKETSQYYPLEKIESLPNDVVKTDLLITESKEDDLWDSPLLYLLFALLITTEWILRKIFRML